MEPTWLDIVDDDVDDAPNPTRRDGTFRVFEFSDDASRLPSLLEQIASWARECAEYQVQHLSVNTETGWTTVAVTVWEVSPGDLIKSLTSQGHCDMAASIANLVTEHGVREGLRMAGPLLELTANPPERGQPQAQVRRRVHHGRPPPSRAPHRSEDLKC